LSTEKGQNVYGRVYVITNLLNGKRYVGQTTKTLRERFLKHKHKKVDTLIHKAIKEFGEKNFTIEELDIGYSREELHEKEIFYIRQLNTFEPNGYNLTVGGQGVKGYKFSEEERRRLSNSHKGYVMPQEQKDKISKSNKKPKTKQHAENISKGLKEYYKQNPISEEARKRMSEARKGIRHTEETKEKISKANKGRKMGEEEYKNYRIRTEAKMRKVRNVETGEEFTNVNVASKQFDNPKLAKQGIRRVCRGERKTYLGCRWEYID